ncbi:MAG TPA: DUF2844 domain-containing protein [Trinickia sp.]|jgi:hypothetical protein|nr:DUF2844 domain-containing protein [Trinickia sp.]
MFIRAIHATVPAALIAVGLLGVAAPARAVLGGAPMSTPADATARTIAPVARAASAIAGSATTAPANYTVKETTLSSGTLVREYIAPNGTVFGIAWIGPRPPDLSELLGSYFPQYVSRINALRAQQGRRGPIAVEDSGLVVRTGGHMGSFAGQAWLPQALPAGVSGDDIR